MLFRPHRIIVHHSLTKDSDTVSWGAIRKYHTSVRGWSDIGYHAGVEMARDHYEAFYGRPITEQGAHTKGHNANTLAICFVGNFDKEVPDPEMLKVGVRRVIAPWCKVFSLGPERIHPHSEFSDKTCPGLAFPMDTLRSMVAVELNLA